MEKLLIIDDDKNFRITLGALLQDLGYSFISADSGYNGLLCALKEQPALIISDLKMPGMDGIEFIKRLHDFDRHIPTIILSGLDEMFVTIEAIQNGAYDYFTKPPDMKKLELTISRALATQRLSQRLDMILSENVTFYSSGENIIGKTPQIREIFKLIGNVSNNRVTVMIQGESGTGKELVARVIHYSGITNEQPFVAINCSAIPENLLESELFGSEKGAFTGAVKEKKGKFELAGYGTIFLDEISELSFDLQAKLLRVFQEKEFYRLGGEQPIKLNARIITATNCNMEDLVEAGKFREDLYYRLKVLNILVPPLRERRDDIPLLVIHFIKKLNQELHKNIKKIPYECMELLQNQEWVGNVRELENTICRALVLSKSDILEKDLLVFPHESKNHNTTDTNTLDISLQEMEKRHILNILTKHKWNKQAACRVLGITKPTLYKKLQTYSIKDNKIN